MALLIILVCVFGAVALMVFFGEKFGQPMGEKQQSNFSKISWILVLLILVGSIIRELI